MLVLGCWRGSWGRVTCWLGCCAALLATSPALAQPVRAVQPLQVNRAELGSVTISSLVLKAETIEDILIVKEKYVVMFLEEMRRLGYPAVGRENIALNQDKSEEAAFVLGGTMTAIDCADERKLTCGVSIDWQLLDRRSNAIVYQVTSSYEEIACSWAVCIPCSLARASSRR